MRLTGFVCTRPFQINFNFWKHFIQNELKSFSKALGKNKSKKIPDIFNLLKNWLSTLSNSLATIFSKAVAALSSKPFLVTDIMESELKVEPGSGLSLSKWFGLISGLHTKLFYSIQSNYFFFRTFVMFTAVTCVNEVIFLQLILFANTAAFFCPLHGLVSHLFWEGDSGEEISTQWRCF